MKQTNTQTTITMANIVDSQKKSVKNSVKSGEETVKNNYAIIFAERIAPAHQEPQEFVRRQVYFRYH